MFVAEDTLGLFLETHNLFEKAVFVKALSGSATSSGHKPGATSSGTHMLSDSMGLRGGVRSCLSNTSLHSLAP